MAGPIMVPAFLFTPPPMKSPQKTPGQAHATIGTALMDIDQGADVTHYTLTQFLDIWESVAIIHGIYPHGHNDPDSGMPTYLRPLAIEARRRLVAGLIDESEFAQFRASEAGARFYLKIETRITHRRGFSQ